MNHSGKTILHLACRAFLVLLVTIAVVTCRYSSTSRRASKALGSCEQGGYLFLRWTEGLEVMLWHDLNGEGTTDSAGFDTGRLFIERGSAHSADGRSITWEVQTVDGTMGEVQIGGSRYDLADGTLYLVATKGGAADVKQLSRDLSDLPLDHDAVLAFARHDPDLAAFLNQNQPATQPPSATSTSLPPTPNPAPVPTATALPPAPIAMPLPPVPPAAPAPAVERIRFAPGATQDLVEGYLPAGGRALYVLGVAAGQFVEMDAAIGAMGQGLRFSIVGADGFVVRPIGEAHVRTVVPSTQDYYVELVSDVDATSYQLSVLIPVRIRFAPGATSATVTGSLEESGMRHYTLRALAGQRMIVAPRATSGRIGMVISGADGQVLLSGRAGPPGGAFDGTLPTSQDYLISVRAEGGTGADYVLAITIPVEP